MTQVTNKTNLNRNIAWNDCDTITNEYLLK